MKKIRKNSVNSEKNVDLPSWRSKGQTNNSDFVEPSLFTGALGGEGGWYQSDHFD